MNMPNDTSVMFTFAELREYMEDLVYVSATIETGIGTFIVRADGSIIRHIPSEPEPVALSERVFDELIRTQEEIRMLLNPGDGRLVEVFVSEVAGYLK